MPPEILELLARINELTSEELTELQTRLAELHSETVEAASTAEDVALLVEIRTATEAVLTEVSVREAAATELANTLDAERAAYAALTSEAPEDAETDAEETADEDAETDAEETTGDDAETDTEEPAAPEAAVEVPVVEVPVAASATTTRRVAPLRQVAARQPSRTRPKAKETSSRTRMFAGGEAIGASAGDGIDGLGQLSQLMTRKLESTSRSVGTWHIATAKWDAPADRTFTEDIAHNDAMVASALQSDEALVASGGICAPPTPFYDLLVIADADTPIIDSLTSFDATRGGISSAPPPVIGSLDNAIVEWTAANDANPTSPTTKPVVEIGCPSFTTTSLSAIPLRLRFTNMAARFFPENVEANNKIALATAARFRETLFLAKMDALTAGGATGNGITYTGTLGYARELLYIVGVKATYLRNKYRSYDRAIKIWLPEWALEAAKLDLARGASHNATLAESMRVAQSEIESWFSDRNITPIWFKDGVSGEKMAGQTYTTGSSVATHFPATTIVRMAFDGTFLHLDGGEMNFSVIRDVSLNQVNKYETMLETFENLAFIGNEALRMTLTICPSGLTSGPLAAATCPA